MEEGHTRLSVVAGMRPEEVYRIQPENVHLSEDYLFNPYGAVSSSQPLSKAFSNAA
jgi:hypothetical protein